MYKLDCVYPVGPWSHEVCGICLYRGECAMDLTKELVPKEIHAESVPLDET